MTKRILPALRHVVQILVDGQDKPRVLDGERVRSLHFNAGVVQSSMRLSEPFELDLSYTRAMMGFQLFNTMPHDILLVGLGGGSLSKYCYRRFSQARVTTLEINPDVIALRDQFLIPADDDRFRIVQANACDYIARDDIQADIILVDGYDAAGLPACLCSEPFYAHCWKALATNGVLVVNLWGGEPNRTVYLDRLKRIFDGRVWWSRPRDSRSLIAFAIKNDRYFPQWSRLMAEARQLDARYRLDLSRVVDDMREHPSIDD
jgi:spermidine synthase